MSTSTTPPKWADVPSTKNESFLNTSTSADTKWDTCNVQCASCSSSSLVFTPVMVFPWQAEDSDPSFWMEDLALLLCHTAMVSWAQVWDLLAILSCRTPNKELLVSLEVRRWCHSLSREDPEASVVSASWWVEGVGVTFLSLSPFQKLRRAECCLPSGTLSSLAFNQHSSATAHF